MKKYSIWHYNVILLLIFVLSATLFSCAEKDLTVTFDYSDGSGRMNELRVIRKSTVEEPKESKRAGYRFDGWYCGEEKWDFDKVVKKDTVLSAHWTPNTYTAHFDANGGECPVTELEMTYGSKIVFPEAKRDGFVFLGWVEEGKYVCSSGGEWLFESDKNYYARWLPGTPGSTVFFGSYEQDNDLDNGSEPIEWLILSEKDGKYLLLSKYVLDGKRLTDSNEYVEYADSNVRIWLNENFLGSAFSDEEKDKICDTGLSDIGVNDKLFLLNTDERILLKNIYEEPSYPTEYARKSAGAKYFVNSEGTKSCFWWLRDANEINGNVLYSAAVNYAQLSGIMGQECCGIRPAMWVDGTDLTVIEKQS